MKWKVWINISHISGIKNRGSASAHVKYILRENECTFFISSVGNNRKEIVSGWAGLENRELEKRHNARFMSKIILPMPNIISTKKLRDICKDIAKEIFRNEFDYTIAVHSGMKEKVHNLHIHMAWNSRSKITGKNDRSFMKKAWREMFISFVRAWLSINKIVEIEYKAGTRKRIPMPVYHKIISGRRLADDDPALASKHYLEYLNNKIEALENEIAKERSEINRERVRSMFDDYLASQINKNKLSRADCFEDGSKVSPNKHM